MVRGNSSRAGVVAAAICALMLFVPVAATADPATNCAAGSAVWTLGGVVLNTDVGSLCQQTDVAFSGDAACVVSHVNPIGLPDAWTGQGAWVVSFANESFTGITPPTATSPNSAMSTGAASSLSFDTYGHAEGLLGAEEACNAQYSASVAAQEAAARAAATGFNPANGAGVATTRIVIADPTGGLPFTEVCANGTVDWTGNAGSAGFTFAGPARTCNGDVPIGADLLGQGGGGL